MSALLKAIHNAMNRNQTKTSQSSRAHGRQTTFRSSKWKPPLEKEIQKFAIEYLRAKGIHCFRHNPTRIVGTGKFIPVPDCEKGIPDICIFHAGTFIGMECKREGENQSDWQKIRQSEIEKQKCLYFVVRTTQDVVDAAERILAL